MKRVITALAGGAVVATVAFASASALQLNGGVIQDSGKVGVSCDRDGVKANWGLETDDSSVRSVRIEGIDEACIGADMFVKVNDGTAKKVTITGTSATVRFDAPYPTAKSIRSVQVLIEG